MHLELESNFEIFINISDKKDLIIYFISLFELCHINLDQLLLKSILTLISKWFLLGVSFYTVRGRKQIRI